MIEIYGNGTEVMIKNSQGTIGTIISCHLICEKPFYEVAYFSFGERKVSFLSEHEFDLLCATKTVNIGFK